MDIYYTAYPISGSPEGLVAADANALFFSRGQIKRINYGGTGSWTDLSFKPQRVPGPYEISQSLDWNPYIYVKTQGQDATSFGWKFLCAGNPFMGPATTPPPPPLGAPLAYFEVVVPSSVNFANEPINVTVTAFDVNSDVYMEYTGSLIVYSTDYQAILPELPGSTFIDGVVTFPAIINTIGDQIVYVMDAYDNSLSGSSNTIIVSESPITTSALAIFSGSTYISSSDVSVLDFGFIPVSGSVTKTFSITNIGTSFTGSVLLNSIQTAFVGAPFITNGDDVFTLTTSSNVDPNLTQADPRDNVVILNPVSNPSYPNTMSMTLTLNWSDQGRPLQYIDIGNNSTGDDNGASFFEFNPTGALSPYYSGGGPDYSYSEGVFGEQFDYIIYFTASDATSPPILQVNRYAPILNNDIISPISMSSPGIVPNDSTSSFGTTAYFSSSIVPFTIANVGEGPMYVNYIILQPIDTSSWTSSFLLTVSSSYNDPWGYVLKINPQSLNTNNSMSIDLTNKWNISNASSTLIVGNNANGNNVGTSSFSDPSFSDPENFGSTQYEYRIDLIAYGGPPPDG